MVFSYKKYYNFEIDLTEEKKFTITATTAEVLDNLKDEFYVEVYLTGDMNATFKHLENRIKDVLELFYNFSEGKVRYKFVNLDEIDDAQQRKQVYNSLIKKGLQPTQLFENKNGKRVEKIIFPGAIISYKDKETSVLFLKGKKGTSPQEQIHQSIEGIEYELIKKIYELSTTIKHRIGFIQGHGELSPQETQDFRRWVDKMFKLDYIHLTQTSLEEYKILIVAQPKQKFSEYEKFLLDQFVMEGGRLVFLIDNININTDSLSKGGSFAFPYKLNLEDMFFRYGVRINNDLILDQQAGMIPLFTGYRGNVPKITPLPWPYYIYFYQFAPHNISRQLGVIYMKYVSSIDTIKTENIKKTPLIFTSKYSLKRQMPANINFNEMRINFNKKDWKQSFLPVAYLLEGEFRSLFDGRFPPKMSNNKKILKKSKGSKILIVSDADFIKNEFDNKGNMKPVNYDAIGRQTLSNLDFIENILSYFIDENGIILARKKSFSFRPLDKFRVQNEKKEWQLFNLIFPISIIIFWGVFWQWYRNKNNRKKL